MLNEIKKACIDSLTGVDNQTYHLAKISWVLALIVYTTVICYNLFHGTPMSLTEVGIGFGAISASHSVTILGMLRDDPGYGKDKTEVK